MAVDGQRRARTRASETAVREFLLASEHGDRATQVRLIILLAGNSVCAAAWAGALTWLLMGRSTLTAVTVLAGASAVRAWANWLAARTAARHALRVRSRLRERAATAALAHGHDAGGSVGATTAMVVDEIDALEGYFSHYRLARLDARQGPLLIVIAVAGASYLAAGILLATLVPLVAVLALAGSAANLEARRQFEALARLSGHFVDRVRALPVVLAFQAEVRETAEVADAAWQVSTRTLRVLRMAFVSTAALEFFAALAVALVAVYCGFALLGLLPFRVPESLDFPRAFFALALAPEFYAPLRRLAGAYHDKQLGEAAAARLIAVLPGNANASAAAPGGRATDTHSAGDAAKAPSAVALPAVSLHAVRLVAGEAVIGPIDGYAAPGALTVITGPSGSGKSTLLACLLGLVPVAAGRLDIDAAGRNGKPVNVSWAGQRPVFLPATVAENLMAAAPGVSLQAACDMAWRVGLGPALARRPRGIHTHMDERGSGFSGGERRRLGLARALLKPAGLLLLDEPTADLDPVAESEIITLITSLAGMRTIIAATHSHVLASHASRIIPLP